MTRAALLDVNVLIALAWPNHVAHRAAREWFTQNSQAGWATTAITELGFVRISSNRGALPTATSPALAVEMLSRMKNLPGHEFWPDAVESVTGQHLDPASLVGHRQVTDAHLLALCCDRGGVLVTFDRAITELLGAEGHAVLVNNRE